MVKYALDINSLDVRDFLSLHGICKEELVKKSIKDFAKPGLNEEVIRIRFKYFNEKQMEIVQEFGKYLVSKQSKPDEFIDGSQDYEVEYEYYDDCQENIENDQNLGTKHKLPELEIPNSIQGSNSTPSVKTSKFTYKFKFPPKVALTTRSQKRFSIDFDQKRQKEMERARKIQEDQEKKLKNVEKNLAKFEKEQKEKRTKGVEAYLDKMKKIKMKAMQHEETYENFLASSLKKHQDLEQKVREHIQNKLRENSEKVKSTRRNGLEKKKLIEEQKDLERSEKFLNKITRIQNVRKKMETKSMEDLQSRVAQSSSNQLKSSSRVIEPSPKLNENFDYFTPRLKEIKIADQNQYKKLQKNELNKLIVGTRISRNKLKLSLNRENLFQKHQEKVNRASEFQLTKQKTIISRKVSSSMIDYNIVIN